MALALALWALAMSSEVLMIPLLTPTPIKLPKKPPTMAPTTGTGMSTCPTMVPVVPPINWQLESHNFRLTVDLN